MRIGAVVLFEQSFCMNTTGRDSQCRQLAATLQADLELSIDDQNEAETPSTLDKHDNHNNVCLILV